MGKCLSYFYLYNYSTNSVNHQLARLLGCELGNRTGDYSTGPMYRSAKVRLNLSHDDLTHPGAAIVKRVRTV